MQVPGEAVRLRIHIGANDTYGGEALVDALIERAREAGLAGATAWRGIAGFGTATQLHRSDLVLARDLPIIIEIIDDAEKIDAFVSATQPMIGTGLVTREQVTVLHYGAMTNTSQ